MTRRVLFWPAALVLLVAGIVSACTVVVEPPPPDQPLLQRNDVIATPHIGGVTLASKDRLWREAISQALQALSGQRPPSIVNPEVWPLQPRPQL